MKKSRRKGFLLGGAGQRRIKDSVWFLAVAAVVNQTAAAAAAASAATLSEKAVSAATASEKAASETMISAEGNPGRLQYEGTTQMTATDFSLGVDLSAAELVIEEVCVEEGSEVRAGDALLKLTQESYEEALAYYEAAIVRADRALSDTQREYDQGILDAEFAYEKAKKKAEQAEFVREYQEEELETAIADHEEIRAELEERIAEVEAGIAEGSYGSGSGAGGTSAGGSSAGRTGQSKGTGQSADMSGAENKSGAEPESEKAETPGADTTDKDAETPGVEIAGGDAETPGADTETPDTESSDAESSQRMEELRGQIAACTAHSEELLEQLRTLLDRTEGGEAVGEETAAEGTAGERLAGDGAGGEETQRADGTDGRQSALSEQLQASIDGDATVLGHMKNVREMAKEIPEAVKVAAAAAGIEYEKYMDLLDECISALEADVQLQREVLTGLSAYAGAVQEPETQTAEDTDVKQMQELLEQLAETGRERSSLYAELTALEETTISEQNQQLADYKEQLASQEAELASREAELASREAELAGQKAQPADQEEQIGKQGGASGPAQSGANTADRGDAGGSVPAASGSGGSGASGGSLFSADSGMSGRGMTMEKLDLTEEDISLFGDSYDLSRIESLLEQEPTGEDAAEALLEQLVESLDTVTEQYAELTRDSQPTRLQIQYTYDTVVLAGRLAEITNRQEQEEWEDTLQAARDAKAELEEQKEALERMPDGVLSAQRDGMIASVYDEAKDVLTGTEPILSYYNTDEAEIVIAVPQEEIAQIQVGDTVDLFLAGMRNQSGTVAEKALLPQEGTSRTTVNYEVTVTVENKENRLRAGMAAALTIRTDGQ